MAWGRLVGASAALAAAELAATIRQPLLVLADDPRHADQLEAEIRFFAGPELEIEHFVEWETLPWDSFSPHQDIVSQRLRVLAALPRMQRGIIIAAASVLQQRLPPVEYVAARSLSLLTGQVLPREDFT
ncbi:MAG: transcription-repair coupling factor, partial [Woeseiaceae bacterium]|nr:transcription-repair coupling factor [Woeseiaceae bacterium]